MQPLLDQLHIELVFTAHPTEAKRRSVRAKLLKIHELLSDSEGLRHLTRLTIKGLATGMRTS